jgi:hypothetical protein
MVGPAPPSSLGGAPPGMPPGMPPPPPPEPYSLYATSISVSIHHSTGFRYEKRISITGQEKTAKWKKTHFIMIGLQTPSSSFCLASYSSFSADWLASSQSVVSVTAFSMVSLSSGSSVSYSFSSFIELRIE